MIVTVQFRTTSWRIAACEQHHVVAEQLTRQARKLRRVQCFCSCLCAAERHTQGGTVTEAPEQGADGVHAELLLFTSAAARRRRRRHCTLCGGLDTVQVLPAEQPAQALQRPRAPGRLQLQLACQGRTGTSCCALL